MVKEITMKEVWGTLSKIDVDPYTEKKMNLTYLSWARAWMLTVDKFADASYEFHDFDGIPYRAYPDSTGEVVTSVRIGKHTRSMALPIMDNRNNAIANPNARQVNDNRMRCLVKNLAMGFGLGMSVFAQHDFLPNEQEEKPKKVAKKKVEKKVEKKAEKKSDDWKVDTNKDKAMIFIDAFLLIAKTFSEGDAEERREGIASHWKKNREDITFLKENFPDLHKALGEDIKTIINQEVKEDE
jgi:hypothetical protein|tara:strand:+ start:58 stop:777 length:720 start_codon:yes stop_codon:yes gene_type:complete